MLGLKLNHVSKGATDIDRYTTGTRDICSWILAKICTKILLQLQTYDIWHVNNSVKTLKWKWCQLHEMFVIDENLIKMLIFMFQCI